MLKLTNLMKIDFTFPSWVDKLTDKQTELWKKYFPAIYENIQNKTHPVLPSVPPVHVAARLLVPLVHVTYKQKDDISLDDYSDSAYAIARVRGVIC